ncbi:putative RING finger protein [Pseudocercospora fuligena]|uniref:Putative RING finger protein n=1 Tax=Pseudocercospora fuligena TaxID=685502 RepID=A0A8H6VIQ8_9PEZI|nr:putative RING finger protein [Pseudocercospora fuligena]
MPGEDRHFANEGGSRKRRKMDRDHQSASNTPADAIVLSSDAPVKAESGPSLPLQTVKAEMNGSHHSGHCEHENSLRTLQTDLEAMRQLITCKICLKFLYEPYALTCGHTYCYSCIMNWMGKDQAQQKKKTCPDCRTIIREQPAPSYLIKEMVLIFSNRVELLPEGETSEEHHAMAREEAEIVAKDKADTDQETGGLFQGRFKRGGRLNPVLAIRDLSDNVYRCPNCAFEIERNWCGPCGMRVVTDEDDDEDMSDETDSMDRELDEDSIDHELDRDMREDELAFGYEGPREDGWTDDDDDASDGGDIHPYHLAEAFENHNYPLPYDSDRDPGDFETDTDASLDNFIDDRDGVDDDVGDESEEAVSTPAVPRRRRGPAIVLSDDEDEDEDEDEGMAPPGRARMSAPSRRARVQSEEASSAGATRESSEPDSDDEEPAVQPRRVIHRHRRIRHLDAESEVDEEDDLDDDGFDEELEPPSDHEAEINLANHLAIHGYSPPPFESDGGETDTGAYASD